jgi:hypothetical protein
MVTVALIRWQINMLKEVFLTQVVTEYLYVDII